MSPTDALLAIRGTCTSDVPTLKGSVEGMALMVITATVRLQHHEHGGMCAGTSLDLIRANAQGPFSLSGFVDKKLWYTGMPSMWLPLQSPHPD